MSRMVERKIEGRWGYDAMLGNQFMHRPCADCTCPDCRIWLYLQGRLRASTIDELIELISNLFCGRGVQDCDCSRCKMLKLLERLKADQEP